MQLTSYDIKEAAAFLQVEEAAIRAVIDLESRGKGFLKDGRPVILFEAHLFSRFTGHRYDQSHPDISRRSWLPGTYGPAGAHQWTRLEKAAQLDRNAAYRAASYGLFQILGDNHKACGCPDLDDFLAQMSKSEAWQLKLFCRFLESTNLVRHLRARNWAAFARGYNGPSYAMHDYDLKLERAYRKHASTVSAHNENYGKRAGRKARVTAGSGLRVRSGPGTEYGIITTLTSGSPVDVIDEKDGWSLISYGNGGLLGHVASRYIS